MFAKFSKSILVIMLMWASGYVAAAEVAFVNVQRVLEEAPQASAANKRLEREFEARNEALAKMRNELRALEDKRAQQASLMSEGQILRLERDIRIRKREIKRAQEDYREDLNIRRNDELRLLQKKVYDTIVTIAKQQKYDLVVGDGVIYHTETVDITSKVLEALAKDMQASP